MKQDENLIGNDNVQLKKIVDIPIKKKWWFIGAFLIVFLSGVLFSFLRTPLYGSGSSIQVIIIDPNIYKNLWEYFPEDANKLAGVTNNMISENLVSEGIKSNLFLDDVSKKLSFIISKKDLKNAIYTRIEGGISLIITVVYSDPGKAYEINKTVFDQYLDNKNSEISDAYNNFLEDVDEKIKTDSTLSDIKSLLVDNKDLFLKRIKIINKPDLGSVYKYYDKKRDLIFSFFLSIAIGLLVVFIVNYIQSVRIKKNNNEKLVP
jgi:capsular polysaccharide biosynthesis protein